jgi:hypothetical protein
MELAVSVGVGTADSVGVGIVGTVVGASVGDTTGAGVVGATAGVDCPAEWLGAVAAVGGAFTAGEQVVLADGFVTVKCPFPFEPVPPEPPGIFWPLPLLLAPPVPPAGVVFPDEDEPMFTMACRTSGTAMAVPANRQTAASAITGRNQAVPNRW